MTDKARQARDGYAFSLAGMTAVAPFVFAPALDAHRINRALDERLRRRRLKREVRRNGGTERRSRADRNGWGPGSPRDIHQNWA